MKTILKLLLVVVCVPPAALYLYGYARHYSETHESSSESANSYAADKMIEDYEFLARNNGPRQDLCFKASAIANAYAAAHEDDNYQTWQAVVARDCQRARR